MTKIRFAAWMIATILLTAALHVTAPPPVERPSALESEQLYLMPLPKPNISLQMASAE